jgi:DNA primase
MLITLDEISEYLQQFKRYDGYGMCLCPFHDDSSPSCQITNRGFYCKACGAKGTLLKLYNKVSNQPIQIRKKVYNPSAGVWKKWEEKFGDIKSVCKIAHQNLVQNNFDEYLVERGLDTASIIDGRLGFLDGYFIFPIIDEFGDIQGATARASKSIQTKNNRYTTSHNCPIKLYVPSWKRVLDAQEIYLCYGIFDAWSLYLAGYPSITGISGQDLNPKNLVQVRKPIYIIPDKKEECAGLYLQSRLEWRGRLLILPWQEYKVKDLNELHIRYGIETLQNLIKKSKEKYNYD